MKLPCKLSMVTTWNVDIENVYIENKCVDCTIDNSEVENEKY